MKVYVASFEEKVKGFDWFDFEIFEIIGIYSTKKLANDVIKEKKEEEDPYDGEFTISIKEFEIDSFL